MAKGSYESSLDLNESHRRHLAVSLRHAAELLDEAERILIATRNASPFRKYSSDLAPWQAGVITDQITAIRRKLAEAGREMTLNVAGYPIDARHAIHVQATFAMNDIEEMHSRYLRGYGALDPGTARRVDALADVLENAIGELDRALAVPPGESLEARIERLSRSPVSPRILKTLEQFVTKYHIPELRRPVATLVERIEQRTLNIAVFGRVSSGKSSLLNALLGAAILPVGVTPITAVPTRIRFGDPGNVRVVYGDKHDETIPIDRLQDLASEVFNPGNRRRVSLLQVRYPSPLLREGIEVVDTPGIGSLAAGGAEETFSYLPRADLAILLVDVGSSIGSDELSVLRLLQSAAIPVQVVISKADLADETSLSRMESYAREIIAAETGLAPAVHPVSAVPDGEQLLRRWVDESIQPLLEKHEALLEASIARTTGAIRDAIVMRLEALANRRPSRSTAAIEEEARGVVHELRRFIAELSRTMEDAIPGVLHAAARQVLDRHDARDAIAGASRQILDDARSKLIARQHATRDRLLKLAASAAIPPELLQLTQSAGELQHMPLLDVAAALPHVEVRPPLFGGAARVSKILNDRFGPPLRDAVRSYASGLHDWAIRSLDRLQAAFTSALDSTSGDVAASDIDLSSLDDDLRALAEMTTGKEGT